MRAQYYFILYFTFLFAIVFLKPTMKIFDIQKPAILVSRRRMGRTGIIGQSRVYGYMFIE